MANTVLGWDIGGAHVKAVLVDDAGVVLDVWQQACPLWQGLDNLTEVIDAISQDLRYKPGLHAVTMTGELADVFPDRHSGVRAIGEVVSGRLDSLRFFAGPASFIEFDELPLHLEYIASANWFASAQFLARQVDTALFVDIGSTTSDLVPLYKGSVQNKGYSDAERMRHEELVYTGVVRTPLMALSSHVHFAGYVCPLAAEHFATTADVYRLTGELDEECDLMQPADGMAKNQESSARRIARMICRDLDDAPLEQWKTLASAFRQLQLDKLKHAALHLQPHAMADAAPIIGAGAGSFLAKVLAEQLGRDYQHAGEFVTAATPALAKSAAVCYPAFAVARLALESVACA